MILSNNVATVKSKIAEACLRVKRDPSEVKLLAVTKTVDNEIIAKLMELGLVEFGENRIQDARAKTTAFPTAKWHFIGSLQTNKVKYCQNISLIHSLDRLSLAEEIEKRASQWGKPMDVLLQVNISEESSKHGLAVNQVFDFAERICQDFQWINIRGLMGMAPHIEQSATRDYFKRMADLQSELKAQVKSDLDILSMGMSNDYEVAIEEGATLVRVGSALFEGEV